MKNVSLRSSLPYSEALFNSSYEMGLIDKTSQDLKLIQDIILTSDELIDFLSNPLVVTKSKKELLRQIFEKQVSTHVLNFLCILVDRRRISILIHIINHYSELVYSLNVTTIVDVYTVVILTDIQKKALEEKLQNMTQSKEVKLLIHLKPELIGGIVIRMGSKVIDMSISGQLNQIANYLNLAII